MQAVCFLVLLFSALCACANPTTYIVQPTTQVITFPSMTNQTSTTFTTTWMSGANLFQDYAWFQRGKGVISSLPFYLSFRSGTNGNSLVFNTRTSTSTWGTPITNVLPPIVQGTPFVIAVSQVGNDDTSTFHVVISQTGVGSWTYDFPRRLLTSLASAIYFLPYTVSPWLNDAVMGSTNFGISAPLMSGAQRVFFTTNPFSIASQTKFVGQWTSGADLFNSLQITQYPDPANLGSIPFYLSFRAGTYGSSMVFNTRNGATWGTATTLSNPLIFGNAFSVNVQSTTSNQFNVTVFNGVTTTNYLFPVVLTLASVQPTGLGFVSEAANTGTAAQLGFSSINLV